MRIRLRSLVLCLALLCGLGWARPVAAQTTATPLSKFAWTQTAPDLSTAQGYTYKIYVDGATTGQQLLGVSVIQGTPGIFEVTAPVIAFTPGRHDVTVTASNFAMESAPSNTLSFNMVLAPNAPAVLHLVLWVAHRMGPSR